MQAYITVGCPTTGGGKVITGQNTFLIEGKAIACMGDQATCPKHKTVSKIVGGCDPHMIINNRAAALANAILDCGCYCLPNQNLVVGENGGGYNQVKNEAVSYFRDPNLNDSFVDDEKYKNYYVECEKTEYLKFKAVIPPYDEDKKNLFNVFSQAISGVADFILTYTINGTRLFTTLSYIPPRLSVDAQIIPFATIHVYREGQKIGLKELKAGEGFWDTSKGKEPVGSCTFTLPEPNLKIVTVEIVFGYIAQLDDGAITPVPSTNSFKFTLTSFSRKVS